MCVQVSYLTLRRVGHTPHCRNHRQGPRGLVGVLLPGNRIVGEGAITEKAHQTNKQTNNISLMSQQVQNESQLKKKAKSFFFFLIRLKNKIKCK